MSTKMILHYLTSFTSLIYYNYNNANNWIFNVKPVIEFVINNVCIIYRSFVISNFKIFNLD